MAQDWLKIKIVNPAAIGKSTMINIDLDAVGMVVRTFDQKGGEMLVLGGVNIPKVQLNELEWNRICRIIDNLPEHKEK
jgi:hypothetical protein